MKAKLLMATGRTYGPGHMVIVSVEQNNNGLYFARMTNPRDKLNTIFCGPRDSFEYVYDQAIDVVGRLRHYYS